MSSSNRKKSAKIISLFMAVALFALSFMLTGCAFYTVLRAEFTETELEIEVDETYDLSGIIEGNTTSYTLSVSPSTVAKLNGTELTGVKAGTATVIATAGNSQSTLDVTVVEAEEDSLSIEAEGELLQTLGNTSEVVFTAAVSGKPAKDNLEWYVNDELKNKVSPTKPFSFTPTEVGKFEVTAKGGDLSASETVRVYKKASVTVTYVGELSQDESALTPIVFTVTVDSVDGNPDNVITWFVDGESVKEDGELKFSYTPTVGTHVIKVKVNGADADISGESSLTVICTGSITPESPTVEFDNVYPHIYVKYDVIGKACIEITSPDGTKTEYSQNSASYAARFTDGAFDAKDLIELCAASSSLKTYRVRVKSLGDGVAQESGWSQSLSLKQLPSAAKPYLSSHFLDADYYITSHEEYAELFEYENLFRSKSYSGTAYYNGSLINVVPVSFDCYMACDADPEALFNDAFNVAATSGNYLKISCDYTSGKVLRTSYSVSTINNPTKQTRSSAPSSYYAKQLHALLPHINFDESKYRGSTHVFPIDRRQNTETVIYSDELYLAAERNTRPVPTAGSKAETVYDLARDVLRKIVTDDMTDVQKAHAIYDWIMWQVTYDTPATNLSSNGESYSAYYLEGVFGDGSTSIGGVKYSPYAVCDGMSKAYSLLCNIEGIPCVRVAGFAGSSQSSLGGHAWNKVLLNGKWYIVDCTWGDATASINLNGSTGTYEVGGHDWLFVTDSYAGDTHFEPNDLKSYSDSYSSIRYAPRTAASGINVYSEMEFNGVKIDCSVGAGEDRISRATEIADSFARAYVPRSEIKVNGIVYDIEYQAFEIYFEDGVGYSESALSSAINSSIKRVLPSATVNCLKMDSMILVLVN